MIYDHSEDTLIICQICCQGTLVILDYCLHVMQMIKALVACILNVTGVSDKMPKM